MATATPAESPVQHASESVIAKLTIKGMGCKPDLVKTIEERSLPLCRIYGTISSLFYKEDKQNGAIHTAFKGQFEGINLQDGEVFRSGVMYLPNGIKEVVESVVLSTQKEDAKAEVKFAFEISSVKATNPIGYSYEARALVKPEREDALAALRQQMLALPAYEKPINDHKKLASGSKK